MQETTQPCLICAQVAKRFIILKNHTYWRCQTCHATFLSPSQMPQSHEEKNHYQHHENNIHDAGYRSFLNKLASPLCTKLTAPSTGLDFGCGPGPALATMLVESGHKMTVYDPFFSPNPASLFKLYQFVTCTEVVEHFHHPKKSFAQLRDLLHPGGWLGIMTCFQTDDEMFATWHYRADPTHVVFYKQETFQYLAAQWGWHCEIPAKDVVLMQKPVH